MGRKPLALPPKSAGRECQSWGIATRDRGAGDAALAFSWCQWRRSGAAVLYLRRDDAQATRPPARAAQQPSPQSLASLRASPNARTRVLSTPAAIVMARFAASTGIRAPVLATRPAARVVSLRRAGVIANALEKKVSVMSEIYCWFTG